MQTKTQELTNNAKIQVREIFGKESLALQTREGEDDLLNSCELFRHMRIEEIKEEQSQTNLLAHKEKLISSYGKLTDLKTELVAFIKQLDYNIEYNPFIGSNQVKKDHP